MDRNVLKDYSTRIADLTTEIVEPISKLVGLSVCLGILDGEANREEIPSPETIKLIIERYCVARGLDNELGYVHKVIDSFYK